MRKFDLARGGLGYGSLPRAQDLADWLGMSWVDVKAVALDESRDKVRTYRSRNRATPRPWGDVNGAALAMKRVSEALGQNYLAATDYDVYRSSAPHAQRELLPTSAQINKLFGSWAEAVARAGLAPSPGGSPRGLSIVEAIGLFVRSQGRLPGRGELESFAADPQWAFPLQRMGEKRWQQWLDDFESWWVGELKNSMPATSPAAHPFMPLTNEDIAALPKRTRAPKGYWNRARVVECVVAYLRANPEVPSVRQPSYRAWAKGRNEAGVWTAAPSTVTRYGTLEELEGEARDKIRSEPSSPG